MTPNSETVQSLSLDGPLAAWQGVVLGVILLALVGWTLFGVRRDARRKTSWVLLGLRHGRRRRSRLDAAWPRAGDNVPPLHAQIARRRHGCQRQHERGGSAQQQGGRPLANGSRERFGSFARGNLRSNSERDGPRPRPVGRSPAKSTGWSRPTAWPLGNGRPGRQVGRAFG